MGGKPSKAAKLQAIIDIVRNRKGNVDELREQLQRHKYLVNLQDSEGWTPLHWAASFRTSVIPMLIENGASVTIQDNDGSTPLHLACRASKPKATALLIKYSSPVNQADRFGRTPLHRAARFGTPQSMIMLIEAGALIDVPDKDGSTPLYLAVQSRRADNIQVLIGYDAFANAENDKGLSPLKLAIRQESKIDHHINAARISQLLMSHPNGNSAVPSLKQLCRYYIQSNFSPEHISRSLLPYDLYAYLGVNAVIVQ
jgi:ankyrin repeat protein